MRDFIKNSVFLVCLFALFSPTNTKAQSDAYMKKLERNIGTSKQLRDDCRVAQDSFNHYVEYTEGTSSYFDYGDSVIAMTSCIQYINGMVDTLVGLQLPEKMFVCFPENVVTDRKVLVRQYLEWVDKNPEKLNSPRSETLFAALVETYACDE